MKKGSGSHQQGQLDLHVTKRRDILQSHPPPPHHTAKPQRQPRDGDDWIQGLDVHSLQYIQTHLNDKSKLIGWEQDSDKTILLKKFDLDMAFGPCIGISRLDRWERAHKLGLNPPLVIKKLVMEANNADNAAINASLWESSILSR